MHTFYYGFVWFILKKVKNIDTKQSNKRNNQNSKSKR